MSLNSKIILSVVKAIINISENALQLLPMSKTTIYIPLFLMLSAKIACYPVVSIKSCNLDEQMLLPGVKGSIHQI